MRVKEAGATASTSDVEVTTSAPLFNGNTNRESLEMTFEFSLPPSRPPKIVSTAKRT